MRWSTDYRPPVPIIGHLYKFPIPIIGQFSNIHSYLSFGEAQQAKVNTDLKIRMLWLSVADLELQLWTASELYAYTPDAVLLLRECWLRATISSMFNNASNTNLLTSVHKHARAGTKKGSHVVTGTISRNCVVMHCYREETSAELQKTYALTWHSW